jgi:uncharacterized protein
MTYLPKFILVGACAALVGCSVFSAQPDHSRFFVLTPISANSAAAARAATLNTASQLSIGIGPVVFPDYLRRASVATRAGTNRIEYSDEQRWAEPLDRNFIRVLSENLGTLLATSSLEQYPWPLASKVDYQVELNVHQFESTDANQARLSVDWMIRDGRNHKILYSSKTDIASPEPEGGASIPSALSSTLATLSREIASALGDLKQQRTSSESASGS